MTQVQMVKNGINALHTIDDAGEDLVRKIAQGEIVMVEIKRPRNLKHHRKFYALMNLVHENVDHQDYPSIDNLVTHMKVVTGHREDMYIEGMLVTIPKSISFAAMDQVEFDAFYERCCDYVVQKIIPNMDKQDLIEEVEYLIGASKPREEVEA